MLIAWDGGSGWLAERKRMVVVFSFLLLEVELIWFGSEVVFPRSHTRPKTLADCSISIGICGDEEWPDRNFSGFVELEANMRSVSAPVIRSLTWRFFERM